MKKTLLLMLAVAVALGISARPKAPQPTLHYDPNAGEARVMTMHDGSIIQYTAYERLYFVTNIEDSAYQFLNVYVPEGATQQTPIFLRTYVGGYMASAAGQPQAGDASGRALKEGYVLVIPGSRGRNSTVVADKKDKKKGIKKGQTINLALKLQNAGKDVNFLLAWNRPHSGDYALDELFEWIKSLE